MMHCHLITRISIHTPYVRERRESTQTAWMCRTQDFNPHSLCRERPVSEVVLDTFIHISIHTPYVGSDLGELVAQIDTK